MASIETARRLIAEEREKKTGFLDLGNLELTEEKSRSTQRAQRSLSRNPKNSLRAPRALR